MVNITAYVNAGRPLLLSDAPQQRGVADLCQNVNSRFTFRQFALDSFHLSLLKYVPLGQIVNQIATI